eukprot:3756540-Prymnesium_polylepis.1
MATPPIIHAACAARRNPMGSTLHTVTGVEAIVKSGNSWILPVRLSGAPRESSRGPSHNKSIDRPTLSLGHCSGVSRRETALAGGEHRG